MCGCVVCEWVCVGVWLGRLFVENQGCESMQTKLAIAGQNGQTDKQTTKLINKQSDCGVIISAPVCSFDDHCRGGPGCIQGVHIQEGQETD